MAGDFVSTLFTETRAQNESTCRWFAIAMIFLAVFHVMIFTPYTALTRQKAEVESARSRQAALQQTLKNIEPQLDTLKATAIDEASRRLTALKADFRATFDRLNTILATLQRMGPDAAAGGDGARLFSPPIALQVQSPVQAQVRGPEGPRLPDMAEELRRRLAAASSRDDVLNAIRPYIEDQIVKPKFADFNTRWKDELASIETTGASLAKTLQVAKAEYPDEAEFLDSVEKTVLAVQGAATALLAEPPQSDPFWWAAPETKEQTIQTFMRDLSDAELASSVAFADLRERTEEAIRAATDSHKTIDEDINRLEAQFKEQQAQLTSMAEPLKVISIDLATFTAHFPLVLSAAFIALTGWLVVRLKQLGQAVALVSRNDTASLASEWFTGYVATSPWHRSSAIFIRATALILWVAIAGYQLMATMLDTRVEAMWASVVGGIGIAVISWYEWDVVRSFQKPALDANRIN